MREILGLRLEHHVQAHAGGRLGDEALERQNGSIVSASALGRSGTDPALHPPPDLAPLLLDGGLRRRRLNLGDVSRPRREPKRERFAIGNVAAR